MAAIRRGGAVVYAPVNVQRQANQRNHVQIRGCVHDCLQSAARGGKQGILKEQIAAGVSGQNQLGQYAKPRAGLSRSFKRIDNRAGVEVHVGHANAGRGGGHLYEALMHNFVPLIYL